MSQRLSIFQKLMLGLVLMFLMIVAVFWLVYRLNVNDIQKELKNNKIAEVKFMTSQLTSHFEQVLMNTTTLSEDQSVRSYPYILVNGDQYSKYEAKLNIINKLALTSASTSWNVLITLYYTDQLETVSSDSSLSFSRFSLPVQPRDKWIIHSEDNQPKYYSILSKSYLGPIYLETRVPLDSLRRLLQQYTSGTPLLYDAMNDVVIQNSSDPLSAEATQRIIPLLQGDQGFLTVDENGTQYLLNYMKSDMLDLYFVDYHPMLQFIEPLSRNNTIFVCSIVLLLLLSLIYTLVLRRQVQKPVITLRQAIGRFDRGDYSSRVSDLNSSEFRMLGNSFNRMAENAQRLIEQVLVGELDIREARLRQYQAQINPHFLYNCLNFIQSKASVEDYEAVSAMTLHLGSYCRYVHNIEQPDSTVEQELVMVEHYLSIMHMRKRSITFSIAVSEAIRRYPLPKMILQPLVENCIKHGIETAVGPGKISIEGEEDEQQFRIVIRDNGAGMSEERLASVRKHIDGLTATEGLSGTGTRNVNQRLRLFFGKRSGLAIESTLSEGTAYLLTIQNEKEENPYAAAIIGR
ncbi:sensor histidine kinase [Paenibacillus donghaensis]|uniref:sensor histidine kinase n=1 Tax=Paenibacillus donghaensis TaxID=414771 RepID=UPI001471DBDE|nr:sensor histidine kinase [Paenibacillus donghaensis]